MKVEDAREWLDAQIEKETKWSEGKKNRVAKRRRKHWAKRDLKYQKRLYDFLVNRSNVIEITTPYEEDNDWTDVFAFNKGKACFLFTLRTQEMWEFDVEEDKEMGYIQEKGPEVMVLSESEKQITVKNILESVENWFNTYYSEFNDDNLLNFVWVDKSVWKAHKRFWFNGK